MAKVEAVLFYRFQFPVPQKFAASTATASITLAKKYYFLRNQKILGSDNHYAKSQQAFSVII